MFKILYLKVKRHPELGNIEFDFIDEREINNHKEPYTSVIIGPNGTGKSFLLRTIAEIFRQFNNFTKTDKKEFSFSFDLHLRYFINGNIFEIISRRLQVLDDKNTRKEYLFFKNRPLDTHFEASEFPFEKITGFEILPRELVFPERLIVNSLMLTDRFVWQKSDPEDFYQYLGVRNTSGSTSTNASSRKTIKNLFNATSSNKDFLKGLKELLIFLEFEENFKVHYYTKINKLFFSGNLSVDNFRKYFEEWWDPSFEYSKRKKENPLWSIPYYNNNFKSNEDKIQGLVDFLNRTSNSPEKLIARYRSSAKILPIDLFDNNLTNSEITMIADLENLDILSLDGIKIKKKDSELSLGGVSSGEYHLLISLIGIFSKISENSLILIDEPEISLHPNWQMKYISFLKAIFSKFPGCHFVITTHSHFLISDLKNESSSVIAMERNSDGLSVKLLDGLNVFGWSAEEILYNIFKLKTVRNYFVEADLTDLLGLISNKSKNRQEITQKLTSLKRIAITKDDPLNAVFDEAEKYLESL